MIRYVTDRSASVDWDEAAEVIFRAPLGGKRRDPARLARAFQESFAVVYAFDGGRLVGMVRALCDREYQAVIYDLVLLPEYQGRGLGRELLSRICAQLPVENIILYAVPGREGFYKRQGFKKMKTAMARLGKSMIDPDRGFVE